MKTYKDFEIFARMHNDMVWECVIDEAAKAGFSRWQIWFYERRIKWKYAGWPRFCVAMRRVGRVVWWGMIAVASFTVYQRIDLLTRTTIYKNQTIVARNALYSCQQMPEVCPSAAKLVKEVMK